MLNLPAVRLFIKENSESFTAAEARGKAQRSE